MIIKGAINRRLTHRLRELFPDGCCRKGTIRRPWRLLWSWEGSFQRINGKTRAVRAMYAR
jgi:hypothetical protein